PFGQMFRCYWVPALLAEELPENECPPVRVKLFSERLVAFRDTEGKYGLIDGFCGHRGVLVWVGRKEGTGLGPKRREWVALPLSRLEIRHDRPVHRRPVGADGVRLLQEDQAEVVSAG